MTDSKVSDPESILKVQMERRQSDDDAKNPFLKHTKEDIKMYQYWYSKATIDALTAEVKDYATRVAFLSTPSVYFSLGECDLRRRSRLFEFDRKFEKAPGFVFYDYKHPEKIPKEYLHAFDYVVIDPPSVREDVLLLYAKAARSLLHQSSSVPKCGTFCCSRKEIITGRGGGPLPRRILISSLAGEKHAKVMYRYFRVSPCVFLPTIPNLIYQYHLYTNYESERLSLPNPDQPEPDPNKTSARSRLADFMVQRSGKKN
mmetsp:Transcript_8029/g.11378  ORF Transcript_8029/g.11378 Transcript_8029/m.11378 type:complete len:258 (+) Transcript_8029:214-987(+)